MTGPLWPFPGKRVSHGVESVFDGPPPGPGERVAHVGLGSTFASCGYSGQTYVLAGVEDWLRANGDPEHRLVTERKRLLTPLPSGPGGSVRHGDDWAPSDYHVIVKHE